jgi:hypothetical protein
VNRPIYNKNYKINTISDKYCRKSMLSHSKTILQQKCLEEVLPHLTNAIERALTDPQEWKSAECRICELLRIACEIKIAGIHAYQDEAKQWSKCIGWATKIIDTIRGISYLAKMAKNCIERSLTGKLVKAMIRLLHWPKK